MVGVVKLGGDMTATRPPAIASLMLRSGWLAPTPVVAIRRYTPPVSADFVLRAYRYDWLGASVSTPKLRLHSSTRHWMCVLRQRLLGAGAWPLHARASCAR